MKKLLNTLYVVSPDCKLKLRNMNIVILNKKDEEMGRVPVHNLEGIVVFGPREITLAVMRICAEKHISLNIMKRYGAFSFRITGKQAGNVMLRKRQYEIAADEQLSLEYAKCFINTFPI